jgi:hypothetical protein
MDNLHFLTRCQMNGEFIQTLPIELVPNDDSQLDVGDQSLEKWLLDFTNTCPLSPFDRLSFSFIDELSTKLLKSPQYRDYPELVALGFWLRKSNLLKKIGSAIKRKEQKSLGLVAHFTPANVDTMFIYSWVASLLVGNLNIVRVASQDSLSKVLLLELINALFAEPKYQDIATRNVFVSYDKLSAASRIICRYADARMMWGGDASVAQIQALPAKPHTRDFCFADKYSVAIVTDTIMTDDKENLAQRLWRDTQAFQQQACSSPRVLYVIQQDTTELALGQALRDLFTRLARNAKVDKGDWSDIGRSNEHFLALQNLAVKQLCRSQNALIGIDLVSAIHLDSLTEQALDLHSGNGLFYVRVVPSLKFAINELASCLPEKLQTISLASHDTSITDSIFNLLEEHIQHQQYRVQPLGEALDFSFHWDGYDLLYHLSQA